MSTKMWNFSVSESIVFEVSLKNIVTKEETAHYVQFILLSHCFQKSSAAGIKMCICEGKCLVSLTSEGYV